MSIVRPADDVPMESVPAGTGAQRQVLLGRDTDSPFQTRRFRMAPNGGMPTHTNSVEHQQYVLSGEAAVGVGALVHHVRAGTILHIPAGVPHWYRVMGDVPFEFLCMVPAAEDRVELLGHGIPDTLPDSPGS